MLGTTRNVSGGRAESSKRLDSVKWLSRSSSLFRSAWQTRTGPEVAFEVRARNRENERVFVAILRSKQRAACYSSALIESVILMTCRYSSEIKTLPQIQEVSLARVTKPFEAQRRVTRLQ